MALGELNLNPDDFYEYSMEELMIKIVGVRKVEEFRQKQELFHTRLISYFTLLPHMDPKKRRPTIDEMFPWFDEDKKGKSRPKRVKDMNAEERQAWKQAMKAHMERMANPQNN